MNDRPTRLNFADEFRICPSCGYTDGFHSVFKREGETIEWLFICPSCSELFDLGFTASVNAPEDD